MSRLLEECRSILQVPTPTYVSTLRLLTVLVTLLTLPGYGWAEFTHVRSCQVQMKDSDHVVMAGDCCPGKADQNSPCKRFGDGAGKNGTCTPCKAGSAARAAAMRAAPECSPPRSTSRPQLPGDFLVAAPVQ